MDRATEEELRLWLEQAAAFVRGGDYTGAVARIEWAHEQLRRRAAAQASADPALEELLRTAEQKLTEYKRFRSEWQEENARRHATYVSRELGAIRAFDRAAER